MQVLKALLFALSLMPLLVACGADDTVVIATVGNYHPFDFINEEGEIDGLERELGDELCRRADLKCEWVINDWEMMIPDLMAEEFDAILAGMSITGKREELIDFTEAYYPPTPSVYLAKGGAGDDAIEGVIGATANTIYSDYFTKLDKPFVSIDGSIDAVMRCSTARWMPYWWTTAMASKRWRNTRANSAIVGPSVLLDRGLGIGFRKGSDLKDKLDEALESMKADGTLNAIILKWIGEGGSTF